jgi:general stress protein YciG
MSERRDQYGSGYYSEIGRKGGKQSNPGNFSNRSRLEVHEAGRKGGQAPADSVGSEDYSRIARQAPRPRRGARRQVDVPVRENRSILLVLLTFPLLLVRATARSPGLARWLVEQAFRFIPVASRDQYEAEWLAEIECLEQKGCATLGFALQVLAGASTTGRALRQRHPATSAGRKKGTVPKPPGWLLGVLAASSAFLLAAPTLTSAPRIQLGLIVVGSAVAGLLAWLPARQHRRRKRRQ